MESLTEGQKMNEKYTTEKEGNMLRITAARKIGLVEIGKRGGLIESTKNLSQDDDS